MHFLEIPDISRCMLSRLILNVSACSRTERHASRCMSCETWSVTDHRVRFACRGSVSPVWRRNQAAQDAKWNHKCRHNPCSLRKCLSTAAHHENAGVAQCRHLHQRRKQKRLLWIKWCQVSSSCALCVSTMLHLTLPLFVLSPDWSIAQWGKHCYYTDWQASLIQVWIHYLVFYSSLSYSLIRCGLPRWGEISPTQFFACCIWKEHRKWSRLLFI